MFAKQIFQKASSRLVTSSCGKQQIIRSAVKVMNMNMMSMRMFATNQAINKLNKALEKEMKYENENYSQLEDIETFLKESGFKYHEEENGIQMTLTKTVGDKTVEIQFESRQPLPDEENQQDQQQEQGQEQEEQPSENYCDFTVVIRDASGKRGLIIEATTMDTEINYNSVQVSENVDEVRKLHRFERQLKSYAGPDFSTLDERIQQSLSEYLEGFGINDHLAAFVECMSLDKDQRLYMQWLNGLKDFIQH